MNSLILWGGREYSSMPKIRYNRNSEEIEHWKLEIEYWKLFETSKDYDVGVKCEQHGTERVWFIIIDSFFSNFYFEFLAYTYHTDMFYLFETKIKDMCSKYEKLRTQSLNISMSKPNQTSVVCWRHKSDSFRSQFYNWP